MNLSPRASIGPPSLDAAPLFASAQLDFSRRTCFPSAGTSESSRSSGASAGTAGRRGAECHGTAAALSCRRGAATAPAAARLMGRDVGTRRGLEGACTARAYARGLRPCPSGARGAWSRNRERATRAAPRRSSLTDGQRRDGARPSAAPSPPFSFFFVSPLPLGAVGRVRRELQLRDTYASKE